MLDHYSHGSRILGRILGILLLWSSFGAFPAQGQWTRLSSTGEGLSNTGGLCKHNGALYLANDSYGLRRSTDGGHHWTSLTDNLPSDAHVTYDVASWNGYLIVATSVGVYRSDDDGANWEVSSGSFGTPPYSYQHAFRFRPLTNELFMIHDAVDIDEGGGLFKTLDSGLTWTAMNSPSWSSSYRPTDLVEKAGIYYASSVFKVYSSSDGGENWENVSGLGTDIEFMSLGVLGDRLVATNNFGTHVVYSQTDGATWSNGSGVGDWPLVGENFVTMDGALFLANDDQVYRSSSGGLTYSPFLGGDLLGPSEEIHRLYVLDDTLYACGDDAIFAHASETVGIVALSSTETTRPEVHWDGQQLSLGNTMPGRHYSADVLNVLGQGMVHRELKDAIAPFTPGICSNGAYLLAIQDDQGGYWSYHLALAR